MSKQELDINNIPNHIAIIMDGNGDGLKKRAFQDSWSQEGINLFVILRGYAEK